MKAIIKFKETPIGRKYIIDDGTEIRGEVLLTHWEGNRIAGTMLIYPGIRNEGVYHFTYSLKSIEEFTVRTWIREEEFMA